MKKVTNTNDHSHSVGYQNSNGEKVNYFFNPGESIEIPKEHESLFKDIEGMKIEDITSDSSDSKKNTEDESKSDAKEESASEVFTCPECGTEFSAKIAMLGHMRSHPKEEVKEENGTSTN